MDRTVKDYVVKDDYVRLRRDAEEGRKNTKGENMNTWLQGKTTFWKGN